MKLIFLILILFTCLDAVTQNKQLYERQLTILNKTVNFGNVKPDTTLIAKFYMINSGTQSVEIEYVNPDCSCTSYRLSKKSIAPKDTAYVELQIDTKNKYGYNKTHSTIKANTFVKMYKFTIVFNIQEE